MPLFAGPGVTPNLRGNVTNAIALGAGQIYKLAVAGWYEIIPGAHTWVQMWDPVQLVYLPYGLKNNAPTLPSLGELQRLYTDGSNYRLANLGGVPTAATITNAGANYTSPPTVTPSAGGSIWRAIIGGSVATPATVVNGGSNYTYPPIVLVSPPPPGGIQATAMCTLSGGAVNAVNMLGGAGYNLPPTLTFVNDPREGTNGLPVGSGASAVAALTGAGTLTGLLCLDYGSYLGAAPGLVFSGGGGAGAAATAVIIDAGSPPGPAPANHDISYVLTT